MSKWPVIRIKIAATQGINPVPAELGDEEYLVSVTPIEERGAPTTYIIQAVYDSGSARKIIRLSEGWWKTEADALWAYTEGFDVPASDGMMPAGLVVQYLLDNKFAELA